MFVGVIEELLIFSHKWWNSPHVLPHNSTDIRVTDGSRHIHPHVLVILEQIFASLVEVFLLSTISIVIIIHVFEILLARSDVLRLVKCYARILNILEIQFVVLSEIL